MDEEKFKLIFQILKSIEESDLKNINIESEISKIIDDFDKDMTDEQRDKLLKEFFKYGRKKQYDKKMDDSREEEDYYFRTKFRADEPV